MKTTKGELRNITTGILHTEIGKVYEFFINYLDMKGIMTHNLPPAYRAIEPIMVRKLAHLPEYFTKEWIKTGLDEAVEIPDLTSEEREEFWSAYQKYNGETWDSIKDRTIIITP